MSLKVCDFFSGCGGTSKGFQNAGLKPAFALDSDPDAANTFQENFPDIAFRNTDITKLDISDFEGFVSRHDQTLFCGCAPCQPFTSQNTEKPNRKKDSRRHLLSVFGDIVVKYLPGYVFVENVPGIQRVAGSSVISRFKKRLEESGYHSTAGIIESQKYGVPQRRRRLVLLASRYAKINLPEPTHGPGSETSYSTVRDRIGHLPPIAAGETHPYVPNHRAANLSQLNLRRIKATPPEGSRTDWPEELHLACHTKRGYSGHTDVYGRMKWNSTATGLTTRCISLSNGRYGHPEQHRAISVREAASLQTFPEDFIFHGSLNSQARQIGNAVPVLLAEKFGKHILDHFSRYAD